MCSSGAHLPVCFPSKFRFLSLHKLNSHSNPIVIRPGNHLGPFSISASIAKKDLELSWVSSDQNSPDDCNGWAIVEAPIKHKKRGKGAALVMICIGASVAALLGAVAFFSLSKNGFKFRFNGLFNTLQGYLLPSRTEGNDIPVEAVESNAFEDKAELSDGYQEGVSDTVKQNVLTESKQNLQKNHQLERIVIPVAVDSTQQEAILQLKKLKIIEDNVKADELCTRREFARWLVRANSLLERSHKYRLVSSAALSGSVAAAFDDVNVEDLDFVHVQCLAEAGIIASKLLDGNISSDLNDSDSQQGVCFYPERYISHQDLISWKAKLEYGVMPGIHKEVSWKNVPFLDARDVSSEALVDVFVDILADEKSILRRVFGQIKRLQPRKPSTKAQAAVALTSGRMAQFIHAELSRLEEENASRQTAMQEIRLELLERGNIQRFWDGKMEEERNHGLVVQTEYLAAIHDLEHEKSIQDNGLAELLKQRAALDCQKQLFSSLKQEVHEMSENLELERSKYMDERSSLETVLRDVQAKYEGLVDARSILEAEIEAVRILRSWVDDEARKSQARAKVLGEVGRRWKWDKKS